MKKILSVLLVLAALLALATSAALAAEIALVTDVGTIDDESFNQACWEGVKAYAEANGKTYQYYQPGADSTDERLNSIDLAVSEGAKVVVCPGYLFGETVAQAQELYPDVSFIAVDVSAGDLGGVDAQQNLYCAVFGEEQAGYLAGYAVVKDGFTKLGFAGGGGGTNPACCRFGYGFAQGANAAAKEMGISVELKYSWQYGASFSASPELQTMIKGWYETGTEIVFACGGSMFSSIVAAAAENEGYVVGVDVDQSSESETVITSAMKGLSSATQWAIGKFYDGKWDEIGGIAQSLGAEEDAVGLPTENWLFETYTVEEYNELLAAIKSGEVVVDGTVVTDDQISSVEFENLTVDYV